MFNQREKAVKCLVLSLKILMNLLVGLSNYQQQEHKNEKKKHENEGEINYIITISLGNPIYLSLFF
jgi:hypothetical protein